MLKNSGAKYGTLLSLYLAQSIPMSFFSTVIPVIMREGDYSLSSIGLIQLIKIPWILKFLWAPVVDRTGATIRGHKKWIFGSEIFYALVILFISFLDFDINFGLIIILLPIAFIASATQDIATDAFAILILKDEERSIGNSMQSAGSFLGTVVGSGILLLIYDYWGWQILLTSLALFVVLALIPLKFYKGKKGIPKRKPSPQISFLDIFSFFKRKGNPKRVALLALFYTGIIGILTMLKPMLVDLEYEKKEIGLFLIFGSAFGALAALLAGYIIKKGNKRKSIFLFALIGLAASTYFTYLTYLSNVNFIHVVIGIAMIWGAYGMSTVIIYTISMDNVRPGREGTDFTIQIVITHLSSLIVAVSSGFIAEYITYKGLFRIEFIITIIVLASVPYLYKETASAIKERSE